MKGWIVLYENEDGSVGCGKLAHTTEDCAIRSIPVLEGRKVLGTTEINIPTEGSNMKGFEFRLEASK